MKLDEDMLVQAKSVAEEFASKFKRKGVIGIVFLGGIARGYFDKFSDIDMEIFKNKETRLNMKKQDEIKYKGFWIDYAISNYEDQMRSKWDMDARWAFSNAKIFYDPENKIRMLIDRKIPLRDEERRRMIIEGMTQSEYFFTSGSELWVYRGDLSSAHYSIYVGLDELLKALYALNNQLLPSAKWRIYQSRSLKWKPQSYDRKLRETLLVESITVSDLRRRRELMCDLWKQMLPIAEKEVGMKFEEFSKMV